MKRIRIFVVTALAAASLGLVAAPASACQPDANCCTDNALNERWKKHTGDDLFICW